MTAFTVALGALGPGIAAMSEAHISERGITALVDYPSALLLLPCLFWGISWGGTGRAHARGSLQAGGRARRSAARRGVPAPALVREGPPWTDTPCPRLVPARFTRPQA
jgi:hypothetical protein